MSLSRHYRVPAYTGRPAVAGIINLTDDSFSGDGGKLNPLEQARQMIADGASMLDLGAESTRPGAAGVPAEVECAKLVPVVTAIRQEFPEIVLSVDTRKSVTAEAVLEAGADLINDVSGLQFDPAVADVVAEHDAGLILMHSRGTPETMQNEENLRYGDLIGEILEFFRRQVKLAGSAGVRHNAIWLDPGVGFAKAVWQNVELIRRAEQFRVPGCPLYYGVSRKSFIGALTGEREASRRDAGTAGVLAVLAQRSVDAVRVHNVRMAVNLLKMFSFFQ